MSSNIRVTIVGGGIGGLSLANMLEKAGIDYIVLEKAMTIRALGSSLGLDATSLPVMEQLGLLEDFYAASKAVRKFNFYNEAIEPIGLVDFSDLEEIFLMTLHAHVLRIPAVIMADIQPSFLIDRPSTESSSRTSQEKESIMASESSPSPKMQNRPLEFYSDVVIGADGAYSAVRQNMFRHLKARGKLSTSDDKPLSYNQHCLVGVSEPLDPEEYSVLKTKTTDFEIVIPKKDPFYAVYMPLPGNRMSWAVIQNVPRADAKSGDSFKFSEWTPEATMEMANFVRHQPNPFNGGTLGDIIDHTPKELISKIMLEEKFFETWHDGRIVLLGDACHKVVPSAGLGANLAVLEAVHLCNLLVELPSVHSKDIDTIFDAYYARRAKIAKAALANSRQFGKVMGDR
ncbi:hypothetical protein BGZ94_002607, partial [Podila epigama]